MITTLILSLFLLSIIAIIISLVYLFLCDVEIKCNKIGKFCRYDKYGILRFSCKKHYRKLLKL